MSQVIDLEALSPPTYAMPPILTIEEAAAFLRLNVKTIYAAVEDEGLPARRMGPRRIVSLRDELLEWLRSNERGRPSMVPGALLSQRDPSRSV